MRSARLQRQVLRAARRACARANGKRGTASAAAASTSDSTGDSRHGQLATKFCFFFYCEQTGVRADARAIGARARVRDIYDEHRSGRTDGRRRALAHALSRAPILSLLSVFVDERRDCARARVDENSAAVAVVSTSGGGGWRRRRRRQLVARDTRQRSASARASDPDRASLRSLVRSSAPPTASNRQWRGFGARARRGRAIVRLDAARLWS